MRNLITRIRNRFRRLDSNYMELRRVYGRCVKEQRKELGL